MITTLRERRKQQTSREIRLAAIELCFEEGFENVTTEAISARSGVSQRTFFNYFPNKEAAIIARPPPFPDDVVTDFVNGSGTFLEDLEALVIAHLGQLEEDREIIRTLRNLIEMHPVLRAAHDASMRLLLAELSGIFARRAPDTDPVVMEMLASAVVMAIGGIIRSIDQDETPFAARADEVFVRLRTMVDVVSQPPVAMG